MTATSPTASACRREASRREFAEVLMDRVVTDLANDFQTDVGSLYLFDVEDQSLVLAATVGLMHRCVGRLRMRLDEGLVGLVAERRAPVMLARAAKHPRFKYFPEADEDEYQSFLGVPIAAGEQLLGVLVVQTIESREFSLLEQVTLCQRALEVGNVLQSLFASRSGLGSGEIY